jgi:WD40 repeat protein
LTPIDFPVFAGGSLSRGSSIRFGDPGRRRRCVLVGVGERRRYCWVSLGWVSFSADGERLVTACTDGAVAVRDPDSGRALAAIGFPASSLASARFLPDGQILVVPWWNDPAYYLWDPSAVHALEFACRPAGRDLTERELESNFGDEPYRETCPNEPEAAASSVTVPLS